MRPRAWLDSAWPTHCSTCISGEHMQAHGVPGPAGPARQQVQGLARDPCGGHLPQEATDQDTAFTAGLRTCLPLAAPCCAPQPWEPRLLCAGYCLFSVHAGSRMWPAGPVPLAPRLLGRVCPGRLQREEQVAQGRLALRSQGCRSTCTYLLGWEPQTPRLPGGCCPCSKLLAGRGGVWEQALLAGATYGCGSRAVTRGSPLQPGDYR